MMISFDKINDNDAEYRISFEDGKQIDLFLLPNTTLTNNFEIIISSIYKMSKVIGENNFNEFIYSLLSNYKNCDSDENRYNLLSKHIEAIAYYSDYFIENNGVDYAVFADENKKNVSSIFFNENEIKKIIKLSEAFKIYSLISNTEVGLSEEYHKNIYNDFVDTLKASDLISKILKLLKTMSLKFEKTIWNEYENIPDWSFNKVMEAFNIITNKGITICQYEQNPIPFFIEIFNNLARWRDRHKEMGIIYGDDESQKGKDDNILPPSRINLDQKRLADKYFLNKLNQISYNYLVDYYINQRKKIKNQKKIDIELLTDRIHQINNISPFWGMILAPFLSKTIGIKYKYLLKQSPQKIAIISFYMGHKMLTIFGSNYISLFNLAYYYPKSKIPETTSYRLVNISHFINSSLKITNEELIKIGGSRIKLVRIIEDLIGKMKTGTVKYCNILTGQDLKITDFAQIEVETIDYLVRYFSNDLVTEIQSLEEYISQDINRL